MLKNVKTGLCHRRLAYKQNMYSFVEFLCGTEERHLLTASWLFGN